MDQNDKMSVRNWLALGGLTFSAFIFNTSEFMPIGLLTDIATDLKITEAHAGLLISVYAWVVALLSLPLMILVRKMEYKRLLLCVIALFLLSHVLSSVATGYGMLMASRIGVACAHSIFWSIASPLAVRVVPDSHRSLALSMIVTGTSVAMIVGLPLGRVIGLHIGWRMAFLCVAAAAFVVFAYLCVVFPRVTNRNSFSLKKLPSLLENPALMGIYVLTLLVATAHYTGYSYIEPFMEQVAALGSGSITFMLSCFGAAGIIGSILFSRYYTAHQRLFVKLAVVCIAVSLLLMQAMSFHPSTMLGLCIFWGIVITAYNVAFQAEIIKYAPGEKTAIAMSVYSGIFNLGIGSGALLGGTVCTYLSISYIGYAGGLLAVVAAVYCIMVLLKRLC